MEYKICKHLDIVSQGFATKILAVVAVVGWPIVLPTYTASGYYVIDVNILKIP